MPGPQWNEQEHGGQSYHEQIKGEEPSEPWQNHSCNSTAVSAAFPQRVRNQRNSFLRAGAVRASSLAASVPAMTFRGTAGIDRCQAAGA